MKFKSQICTTKIQSERLLALGLKKETADMVHVAFGGGGLMERPYEWLSVSEIDMENFIPAWSLHRLIELYKDVEDTSMWSLDCITYNRLIQCIGLAIKHGAFNQEYLEE